MAGILLPKPGMVIRYDYLWADDATAGKDAGKDRPMPEPRHAIFT